MRFSSLLPSLLNFHPALQFSMQWCPSFLYFLPFSRSLSATRLLVKCSPPNRAVWKTVAITIDEAEVKAEKV
ncbi:hypothetical protein B0T09DRAFT_80729 [Sordaria sp. MPI-SDFR-AT-0083]|nr:hypothetical protein B0T09DRAFT_80729 [Sordaria sp. MPI-SDFR-AT-0083]